MGIHRRHRRAALIPEEGVLPTGVSSRLALLWAAPGDPALLTGGAGRGHRTRQEARQQLISDSIARGPDVDLLAPVTLPVRCGRPVHLVRLEADDEVVLEAHPDLDAETERVAASLGGELLPCLRAADEADLSWPPPVADDGPRLGGGIEAGELLSFVRIARSWLRHGYDLASCAAALELGVRHDQVDGHLGLGLDVATSVQWRGVSPYDALRWHSIGFSRDDVALWTEQGRTLEQAEDAAAAVGDGRWLARWARIAGSGPPADALAEWASFGVPVGVWGEAASRGLRARDVPAWLATGFQPVEVLRYAHLRVPLEEATAWRDAGFTAYVATGYLGVGMTLEDACALRGLPSKQVQEVWRGCGSVAAVLEALAS